MTTAGAFAGLAAFPLLVLFFWPEPVEIRWGYSHARLRVPLPPLPPELKVVSERNQRYIMLVQYALLVGSVYLLMRRYSVPPAAVGLQSRQWGAWLGLGVAVGLARLALLEATRALSKRLDRSHDEPVNELERYMAQGSLRFWVAAQLVICFAQEFWRAFCLAGLLDLRHSATFAVAITSLAFAAAHFRGRGSRAPVEFGRFVGHTVSGVLFAIVFLWSGSIVATYTAHLLVNFVALYRARRAQTTQEPARLDSERSGR